MTRQAGEVDAATTAAMARGGVPLVSLAHALAEWLELRHLELMARAGFDDVRGAHNAVFRDLPAEGSRLTDLAARAGMTKQAMGELVEHLEDRGYLRREPDPTDGRAKLILWDERGEAAHRRTLEVFAEIEDELAARLGSDVLATLRGGLERALFEVVAPGPPGSASSPAPGAPTGGGAPP